MKGLIVSSSCGSYDVKINNDIIKVKGRGLLRQKKIRLVVGDFVELDLSNQIILNIFPRQSFLKRPPIANITQIILVLSLVEPEFSYYLAFKFLTYANLNNLKACLVITKIDKSNDQNLKDEIKQVFDCVNVKTIFVCNKSKEGIDEVKDVLKDEISCIMGQTGVGKSSLINALDINYTRDIGEYSKALGRGKHQTKEVVLLPYQDTYIADTPGFSSLDLDLSKEDLAAYFPSFNRLYNKCYFANCLHLSENRCAVKEHLASLKISPLAYEIYQRLSTSAPIKNKRYPK